MSIHRTGIKITPSFVIGCGGMGTLAAYYCRQIALQELFDGNERKLDNFRPVRYLAVDSSEQALRELSIPHHIRTISFGSQEIFNVLRDPDYPQVGNGVKAVKSLFPPDRDYERVLNTLPDPSQGNGTCPPIGRMGFLANWESVYNRLKQEFQTAWGSPLSSNWDMEDLYEMNQIFILAGLYGGTGCGIHVDLAAMIRSVLKELELPAKVIYGIFLLPDLVGTKDEVLRANAYAALSELDYFAAGNPYEVALANGNLVRVTQTGNDWLFNKIFLINDRNLRDIPLSENEAAKMVGTVVFHWSHTVLGSEINKRLQDRPSIKVTSLAPEKGNHRGERRPTFYSTFGYATAHIPYETLKHNLAVKFALRTMHELMLVPEKPVGQTEMMERREKIYQRDFQIDEALRRLDLDDQKFQEYFNIPLPRFVRMTSLKEYMEDFGENSLEKAFRQIRKDIFKLKNIDEEVKGNSETGESLYSRLIRFEQKFQEELRGYKDELLNQFGPILTSRAIRDIQERVREMMHTPEDSKQESTGNIQLVLDGLLKKGDRFISEYEGNLISQLLPFARNQKLREFEQTVFKSLRSACRVLHDEQLKNLKKRVLSRCLDVLKNQIKDLESEKERYDRVLENLRKARREYSEEKTYFCPIPLAVLDDYLNNLHFRPGYTPKDFARRLRQEGLSVPSNNGEKNIPVSEFDDYPDEVCPQLIKESARIIEEAGIIWNRPFSESGFYSLTGTSGYEIHEYWYVPSYRLTWEELVKRSAPYLEYHDNLEFDTFKEAYIIYPGDMEQAKNPDKENDELREWKKVSVLECDRSYPFTGVSPVSPYHISILQMHYGLPIYSIDEIVDWRDALQKCLNDPIRRPYYKTNLPLEDPYIEITSEVRLSRSDVEELYNWAKSVSEKGYPIFKTFLGKSSSYLASFEPKVREFYFDLYEERYFSPDEIVALVKENQEFRTHLVRLLEGRLPALIKQNKVEASPKLRTLLDTFGVNADDPNFVQGEECLSLVQEILAELCKIHNLPRESGFLSTENALHVVADYQITGNVHSLVRSRFCQIQKNPPLKQNIRREDEIKELMSNPVFYRELMKRCLEILQYHPHLNDENLPRLLRRDS